MVECLVCFNDMDADQDANEEYKIICPVCGAVHIAVNNDQGFPDVMLWDGDY